MKRFYTSDTHFGHKNILQLSNRPFSSIEEHDEHLIDAWNSVVSKNDIVYHLGDFALSGVEYMKSIVSRLNGRITLIRGNHDRAPRTYYELGFHNVYDFRAKKIGDVTTLLCHYPYYMLSKDIESEEWVRRMFRPCDYGSTLIHGHTHSIEKGDDRVINVCVDCRGYEPVCEDEIIYQMKHFR